MNASLFKAISSWIADSFLKPSYSVAEDLTAMAASFAAAFLFSRFIILLIEGCRRYLTGKVLPWSGTILALLFASAFWLYFFFTIIDMLRGQLASFNFFLFLVIFVWLLNPSSLLGLFGLIWYLAKPEKPRILFLAIVIVTMIGSYFFRMPGFD